jgi:hypothetical protein
MSELIYIENIKADAEAAADAGKRSDACPKSYSPRNAELWLHYFYSRQDQNERVAA